MIVKYIWVFFAHYLQNNGVWFLSPNKCWIHYLLLMIRTWCKWCCDLRAPELVGKHTLEALSQHLRSPAPLNTPGWREVPQLFGSSQPWHQSDERNFGHNLAWVTTWPHHQRGTRSRMDQPSCPGSLTSRSWDGKWWLCFKPPSSGWFGGQCGHLE